MRAIKLIFVIIIFVLGATVYGLITHKEPAQITQKHKEVLQNIVIKEDKVTGGDWITGNLLRVTVNDDYSDRSGYALYVCELLKRKIYDQDSLNVQVIDDNYYYNHHKVKILGKANCY